MGFKNGLEPWESKKIEGSYTNIVGLPVAQVLATLEKNLQVMKKLLLFLLAPFIGMAQLSQTFKNHWFDGFAEISSYELTQSRYGQQRIGKAVLIFVTEDFLAKEQVKANQKSKTTIPVLKSNRTKNFLTGIYPYSIMSSSFSSLRKKPFIKTVASIQEWCGQSYLQLNAGEKENTLISHSYFEGEADQNLILPKTASEDELWNLIRFNPKIFR